MFDSLILFGQWSFYLSFVILWDEVLHLCICMVECCHIPRTSSQRSVQLFAIPGLAKQWVQLDVDAKQEWDGLKWWAPVGIHQQLQLNKITSEIAKRHSQFDRLFLDGKEQKSPNN